MRKGRSPAVLKRPRPRDDVEPMGRPRVALREVIARKNKN